jgi:hypothetical protein
MAIRIQLGSAISKLWGSTPPTRPVNSGLSPTKMILETLGNNGHEHIL